MKFTEMGDELQKLAMVAERTRQAVQIPDTLWAEILQAQGAAAAYRARVAPTVVLLAEQVSDPALREGIERYAEMVAVARQAAATVPSLVGSPIVLDAEESATALADRSAAESVYDLREGIAAKEQRIAELEAQIRDRDMAELTDAELYPPLESDDFSRN